MFNDSVQEINNPFDGSTKTTRRMSKIGKFSSIGQFHGLNHSVGSFGSTKKMSNPPSPPSSPSLTSLETGTTPPLDTFKSKSLSSRVRSKIKAKGEARNVNISIESRIRWCLFETYTLTNQHCNSRPSFQSLLRFASLIAKFPPSTQSPGTLMGRQKFTRTGRPSSPKWKTISQKEKKKRLR